MLAEGSGASTNTGSIVHRRTSSGDTEEMGDRSATRQRRPRSWPWTSTTLLVCLPIAVVVGVLVGRADRSYGQGVAAFGGVIGLGQLLLTYLQMVNE